MLVSMIAAMALMQVAPSAPETGVVAPPPPAAAQAPRRDDDKVVCQEVASTGSVIARQVCRTNAQWRQMTDDGQQSLHYASQYRGQGSTGGH